MQNAFVHVDNILAFEKLICKEYFFKWWVKHQKGHADTDSFKHHGP